MNKIKQLNVTNFRHLHNLNNINVGDKLTVIAGVNGTGKSSLLGLIGHPTWSPKLNGELVTAFTESEIEIFSLDELKQLGFSYIPGPSIAPDVEATQGFLV